MRQDKTVICLFTLIIFLSSAIIAQQIQVYQISTQVRQLNELQQWLYDNYGVTSIEELKTKLRQQTEGQYRGNPFVTSLYPGQLQAENITGMHWYTWLSGTLYNRTDVVAYPSQPARFIVENVSGTVIWKDGTNGTVYATGTTPTEATNIINWALGNLTSGRTWKEKVVLKDDFEVSDTIDLVDYLILDLTQARVKLANNVNKPPIALDSLQEVDIIGGVVDGNKANQTGYPAGVRGVINIDDCQNVNVYSTKVINGYQDGIYVVFKTAGKKSVNLFNVIVESPNQDGIFYDTDNLDLNVDSLIFKPRIISAGDNPINLSDLQGVTVINPVIESPANPLRIEDCQGVEIYNPIIRNPSSHGIVIDSSRRAVGKNKIFGGEITSETASPNRGLYILRSQDNYIEGLTVCNFSGSFRIDTAGATPEVRRNILKLCVADTPGYEAFSTGGSGGDNKFLDCVVLNLGSATAFNLRLSGDSAERFMVDGKPSWNGGTATGLADGSYIANGLAGTPTTVTLTCLNSTYDGVPVIVSWDKANTNSTHIAMDIYWANGTAITDSVIAVSWYAEYNP